MQRAQKHKWDPAHQWLKLGLVLKRNLWGAASLWWAEQLKQDPRIPERVDFSGPQLGDALVMCSRNLVGSLDLAKMVQQVAFAAHVIRAGVGCFTQKRRRK